MLQSEIINNDLYIIFQEEYNINNAQVVRLKNGVEIEIFNDEISCIIFPNFMKQLTGMNDINEIKVNNVMIDFKQVMHVSLEIDGNIVNLQFDCTELINRNI